MNNFAYFRPDNVSSALDLFAQNAEPQFLAGGTNLIDLMREGINRPQSVIDLSRLPLDKVEELPDGSLRVGALVRNSNLAEHALIRERYPFLSQAILMGASGQLRNMATTGGNLMQRTRCYYFYDDVARCNKRTPGSGCDAIDGFNRIHAILGASPECVATHPSDMCVVLAALDAAVNVTGRAGQRTIPLTDFHRLPDSAPERDTVLAPGEIILSVDIPPVPIARHSIYRKVRDRASYAFALVSVAAAIEVQDGAIKEVRLALGGVAHKPWRARAAEQYLIGKQANEASFAEAAALELEPAVPLHYNGFKIELARRTIVSVLLQLCKGGAH
jgi:xanthine dehydrogenase YagS FAD-binding subunit